MLESWIMDVRYVGRRLLSRRTYALLAVLTLSAGTGGAAAIYSIVRAVLLKPLPYAHEGEVGVFWQPFGWTEEEFLYLRPLARGFRSIAAYATHDVTVRLTSGPLHVMPAVAASAELFDVLGAQPGIYGVLAHFVERRGRDWSIRIALGLSPVGALAHVLARTSRLVAGGAVIGVFGAIVLARLLSSFLYGVHAADPVTVATVVLMLVVVGLSAGYVPARRAARADPAQTLRGE